MDTFLGSGPDPTLINPTVNIPIILFAFLILIVLGTLIGLIPAYMATLVKPIDALRDE
jgi:putative ABC transport system permease protein